jgi:hypothetical protein
VRSSFPPYLICEIHRYPFNGVLINLPIRGGSINQESKKRL